MTQPTAPDISKLDDVYPFSNHPLKIYPKLKTDKVTEIVTTELNKKLYPSLDPMQSIIDQKIQANNKFNNNVMIIKDMKNFYENECSKYKKKLSKWEKYFHISKVVEIIVSSASSAAAGTAVSVTGIGLPFAVPTVMGTTLTCGIISAGVNNQFKKQVNSYTKKYILAKQFAEKYNELFHKVTRDNEIDTQEYEQCTQMYEKYKKSKKSFYEVFF